MAWADQHCHLPPDPHEAQDWVNEARAAGVNAIVNVGTALQSSREALAVARACRGVWATAGVHPHDASDGIDGLEELIRSSGPELVAVGEAGLDYHYDHSPRDAQREVFAAQIDIANRHGLALVVHSRSAWEDTFDTLDREGMPPRTVMHCFTGGPDEASACLQRGAMLSFSGIVTFPKAPELRAAAAVCPNDRMMVETDSPYLAPVPHRGRPNRPAWVTVVGAAVAEAKSADLAEVQRATWDNTMAFYGLSADGLQRSAPSGETAG